MGAQAQPSRPQPAGSGVLLALLVAVLVVVIAAGTGVMAYEARYRDRIYAGVSVLGVPVGGLEPAEALERVGEVLAGATLPVVVLHDGVDAAHASNRWTVGAGDLGAHLDLESALREAWAVGRSGIFRHDMAAQARALWWGYDVVPPVKLEPGTVALTIRRIAGQAGYRARPAQLRVTSLQAVIGEAQAGREVDLAASYAAIEGALRAALGSSAWGGTPRLRAWAVGAAAPPRLPTRPVAVALAFRDTLPVSADLGEAEARIDALLSAPLILTLAATDGDGRAIGRRWAVDQATLAAWIDVAPADDSQAPGTVRGAGEAGSQDGVAVQVGIDREQVTAYLARIAEEIARPPREPRFDYDPASQTLTLLAPEQSGLSLDAHLAAERVIAAWSAGQHEVALPVTVVEPRVTRAALQALMPLELISEGVSSFVGSSAERLQNIRVATERFYGLAIPPQATFSFLQHLGPVTAANGYSESWVIYDDRTILGPGGGVCQVSTTCFRAAFWGGYPIVERLPHYYRVSWYEPPIGLDASVYSPSVDLSFRNDTDTPILIITEVNEAQARLSFRFYGRSSGRKVTMEGPTTSNPRPAGKPIYEEDPTLSPGARVQVDSAHDGIDVSVVRVITLPDGQSVREEFVSRYQPWPARYRVGPKASATGGDDGS